MQPIDSTTLPALTVVPAAANRSGAQALEPAKHLSKQSPAAEVSIGNFNAELPNNITPYTRAADSRTEPDTYAAFATTMTYLRNEDNAQQGITSAQVSKTLAAHLSSLTDKYEPFRPGLFFSHAATLSRETSSYSNEARSMRLPGNVAPETARPDFSKTAGIILTSATLSIRTRDGDVINMNLTRGLSGGSLVFTFDVDGDLSEAEQQALEQLAVKLGEVADEYFRSGTAELRGLGDFDSEAFHSFSLSLSQFNGKDYDTFSYNYAVDETTKMAHLTGEDAFGYEFDISSHLQNLTSGKNAFAHQSLEQYLDLIRRSANEHQAQSSSTRFMLDGLRSMLLSNAKNVTESPSSFERTLDSLGTGIPDFKATFSSPTVHNPNLYTQVSYMHLSMGQTTRVETTNSRTLIQQENFYELSESHWLASPGLEQAQLELGNYRYINQHVRESITRTLDTEGGSVKDILVLRDKEWSHKEQEFINFKAQPASTSGDAHRTLINLIDQFDDHETDNQPKLLKLLETSRANLFTGW